MKILFVLAATVTLSAPAFAGNMSSNNEVKPTVNEMKDERIAENILQNEKMQRLHKRMTRDAASEGGMEARLDMMTKEGRAYHEALEQRRKNAAG